MVSGGLDVGEITECLIRAHRSFIALDRFRFFGMLAKRKNPERECEIFDFVL